MTVATKYTVLIIVALLSVLTIFFNKNLPRIFSGVDQVLDDRIYVALWLLVLSAPLAFFLSFVFDQVRGLRCVAATLSVSLYSVLLLFSVAAFYVDTYDMMAHVNEERALVNAFSLAVSVVSFNFSSKKWRR
ncbi:MAG: hypothetical protein AAGP08_11910 [Pseudomonadota bacterium]